MVFLKYLNRTEWTDSCSVPEIKAVFYAQNEIIDEFQGNFSFYHNGRKIRENKEADDGILPWNGTVEVALGLPGGKGGFGSMLRCIGAQIDKTNNKDACRDLSGRRIRDINEEEKLKAWVAKEADREREAAERKEAKLDKLRRLVHEENKHEFHDPVYEKARSEVTEKVHDAMEAAMKAAKNEAGPSGVKRKLPAPSTSGSSSSSSGDESQKKSAPPQKKNRLWMGVDLTESDLESSSDED